MPLNIARRRSHFKPGALRDEVLFQRKVRVDDGQGGHVASWETVENLPAKISDSFGTELLREGGVVDRIFVRVVVPKPDFEITGDDRFVEGPDPAGRVLYITAVRDVDNQHRYLECDCTDTLP